MFIVHALRALSPSLTETAAAAAALSATPPQPLWRAFAPVMAMAGRRLQPLWRAFAPVMVGMRLHPWWRASGDATWMVSSVSLCSRDLLALVLGMAPCCVLQELQLLAVCV